MWSGWRKTAAPSLPKRIPSSSPGIFPGACGLEETGKDFAFIESLPGKKLLLKGNHDYWWSTRNKIETFFAQKGFKTMRLVFNSAERVGDITVCGTRGWLYNAETAEDKKIVARENGVSSRP